VTSVPACPCETFNHPRVVTNPSGHDGVDYRTGDYATFRQALLMARPAESALANWHPIQGTDLALQMLEWWAYLADILTFYNERALNELLLRTAVLPEDVNRIVRLLGYRPRPGIGAVGVVAAETKSVRPFTLPRGFPIQGRSASGESAQIFEVNEDVEVGRLGRPLPTHISYPPPPGRVTGWSGYPAKDPSGYLLDALAATPQPVPVKVQGGATTNIALRGVVTGLNPDDTILILRRDWNGGDYVSAVVRAVQHTWDALDKPITVVKLLGTTGTLNAVDRENYRVLRSTKLAHLWLYHYRYPGSSSQAAAAGSAGLTVLGFLLDPVASTARALSSPPRPPEDPHVLTNSFAHLEAITRGIRPGDPVLFEQTLGANGKTQELVQVTGYSEEIWYANPPEPDRYGQGPPVGPPSQQPLGGLLGGQAAPIPIPHSKITFNGTNIEPMADAVEGQMLPVPGMALGLKTVVVHYGWQEVGALVELPDAPAPKQATVVAPLGVPNDVQLPVLIEGSTGEGVAAWLGTTTIPGEQSALPPGDLRALIHLMPVSRGQTVTREVLGSGDPAATGQVFALRFSPLTYLRDTGAKSVDGYRSTLRIHVDGIEWFEVPSFYGQAAAARVFVTREDEEQRTHVRFGDGINGARLPAGIDNVVADYRFGSGSELPVPQSLTTILRPLPGLRAIRNPVPVAGGTDPDPPDRIRRYAPRSVLAFGRAISGDDYETVASQTPGVTRARVYFAWDVACQRTLVKVYVGDTDDAVLAVRAAFRSVADPNRPVLVARARPLRCDVTFTIAVDSTYDPDTVSGAVRAALLDPAREPLGGNAVKIDQTLYDSELYETCLSVSGVVAARDLKFWVLPELGDREPLSLETGFPHSPGEGKFYLLDSAHLHINVETSSHAK
jgi:hypothetical protein